MQYIEKLEEVEKKFGELEQQMADPAVIGDASAYRRVSKQRSELEELVGKYGQWKNASRNYEQAKVMMNDADADVRFMASEEIAVLEPELQTLEEDLRVLLLPKDPNDAKDVIIQVRAGAGGDEASLFAAEVFRMYVRYAETRGWKVEVTDQSDSEAGGVKEIDAIISGDKVYSRLKHEGGVHRVQRVPATETQGRIHTSTITVAVLPEADEVEVQIEAKDIRIDTFCSSGPGGQSVNTTYSAVRITHLPTNTVVSCQDEKSQIKNREKALRVLRSRLYELEMEKQQAAIGADRRSQVGTGDRSEKIRTYNFKDNRVTDHRIGLTLHQLDQVMQGRLDPLLDALTTAFNARKMAENNGSSNN